MSIPVEGVMVVEGELTGDGRMFEKGSIFWDDTVLPLPILFDRNDGDHSGVTVGFIDSVRRVGDEIRGSGWLSDSADPQVQADVARVGELLDEGAVGVSVSVDSVRGDLRIPRQVASEDRNGTLLVNIDYDSMVLGFSSARLRHLAVVDTAAFARAGLQRSQLSGALVASAGIGDTNHFFDDPKFGSPGDDPRLRFDPGTGRWSCPPTIEGNHYYGHVAPSGVCLRGRPEACINPPDGDLEGFMRAFAPAAGGRRTGVVPVGGSHASVGVGVVEASKHYDKTGRAAADVRVGKDAYGIWFSGMIRPGLSKDDRYALAASDVSGHWELDQRGRPTLVGLPAVNVGGFPKGYLTAAEVASGLAASAEVCEPCDEDEALFAEYEAVVANG